MNTLAIEVQGKSAAVCPNECTTEHSESACDHDATCSDYQGSESLCSVHQSRTTMLQLQSPRLSWTRCTIKRGLLLTFGPPRVDCTRRSAILDVDYLICRYSTATDSKFRRALVELCNIYSRLLQKTHSATNMHLSPYNCMRLDVTAA